MAEDSNPGKSYAEARPAVSWSKERISKPVSLPHESGRATSRPDLLAVTTRGNAPGCALYPGSG